MINSVLVCPECKGKLVGRDKFKCAKCGREGEFKDGVYQFVKKNYYWGEISPQEMQEVLDRSRSIGWQEAVLELITRYPKMEEYLLNHGRVDWLFHCLSSSKKGSCLDIGSGWGSLAFDLTPYFSDVYSLEAIAERIEFQAIRKAQDDVTNIHLVRANFQKLPFADNSLDLVVVNGVLEWVGINNYQKSPEELQKEFLQEIHRVLKPGGCVYIGIENRFGLHYLMGATDHSGMPFTSLLPRFVADLAISYFRKTKGQYNLDVRMEDEWPNYRTYTYSLNGYQNLLSESGYAQVDSYWTLFYSNPKFSGPIDGRNFKFFLEYIASRSQRANKSIGSILASLGTYLPDSLLGMVVKYFAPSFLLYGYKQKRDTTVEDSIVASEGQVRSFLKLGGSGASEAKITYFLLNQKTMTAVVKLPRFPQYAKALETQEQLAKTYVKNLNMVQKKVLGINYYREDVITGKPVSIQSGAESKLVINWLLDFQERTKVKGNLHSYLALESKKLLQHLQSLSLTENEKEKIKDAVMGFLDKIRSRSIPMTAQHGDFCAMNILIDAKWKLYVLDWEDFQAKGNPFNDVAFLAVQSLVEEHGLDKLMENLRGVKVVEKFLAKYAVDYDTFLLATTWMALKYSYTSSLSPAGHLGYREYYLSLLKKCAN